MKLALNSAMNFKSMEEALTEKFPDYKVKMKKNPMLGFEYIEVAKSGTVGVWIRIMPKKNHLNLIKCFPSFWVRLLFVGVILIAFVNGKQNEVRKEVGTFLVEYYNTTIL